MATTETRSRLDKTIDTRRLELRKQWSDIAAHAGISIAHLRRIRKGEPCSDLIAARIDDALRWQQGSLTAVRAGGDPTPLPLGIANSSSRPGKTLGELLLERGLRTPDQLGLSDEIRDDPVALEIIGADEFSESTVNAMLSAYATMRRQVFEAVLHEKRRPRE